eukprot:12924843-Prorocentrum_lima.AAC.1
MQVPPASGTVCAGRSVQQGSAALTRTRQCVAAGSRPVGRGSGQGCRPAPLCERLARQALL